MCDFSEAKTHSFPLKNGYTIQLCDYRMAFRLYRYNLYANVSKEEETKCKVSMNERAFVFVFKEQDLVCARAFRKAFREFCWKVSSSEPLVAREQTSFIADKKSKKIVGISMKLTIPDHNSLASIRFVSDCCEINENRKLESILKLKAKLLRRSLKMSCVGRSDLLRKEMPVLLYWETLTRKALESISIVYHASEKINKQTTL